MRLAVLGCYGGSAPGRRPSSLLVDGRLALDAGALTTTLSLAEQARVDEVYVTHAHLDHVATLPFLIDNVFALRETPVRVLGSRATIDALRTHLFNDAIWPDFSRLSNGRSAPLAFVELDDDREVVSGDLALRPFAMDHTVDCRGYLLQGPESALAVCSDTVGLAGLPAAVARARGLAAILLEVSFPEASAEVAAVSKHLTPRAFAALVRQLPRGVPVFVWHMKPDAVEQLSDEIASLDLPDVALLEQDRVYVF